jgi:hypothetical protein
MRRPAGRFVSSLRLPAVVGGVVRKRRFLLGVRGGTHPFLAWNAARVWFFYFVMAPPASEVKNPRASSAYVGIRRKSLVKIQEGPQRFVFIWIL